MVVHTETLLDTNALDARRLKQLEKEVGVSLEWENPSDVQLLLECQYVKPIEEEVDTVLKVEITDLENTHNFVEAEQREVVLDVAIILLEQEIKEFATVRQLEFSQKVTEDFPGENPDRVDLIDILLGPETESVSASYERFSAQNPPDIQENMIEAILTGKVELTTDRRPSKVFEILEGKALYQECVVAREGLPPRTKDYQHTVAPNDPIFVLHCVLNNASEKNRAPSSITDSPHGMHGWAKLLQHYFEHHPQMHPEMMTVYESFTNTYDLQDNFERIQLNDYATAYSILAVCYSPLFQTQLREIAMTSGFKNYRRMVLEFLEIAIDGKGFESELTKENLKKFIHQFKTFLKCYHHLNFTPSDNPGDEQACSGSDALGNLFVENIFQRFLQYQAKRARKKNPVAS